jgi:dTDP-4-dehydrorhamnose reductase
VAKKLKVLITGSNGLLGQKVIDLHAQYGVDLIATSAGEDRDSRLGYLYQSLDITDREAVFQAVALHEPDVVINTAAMTNVDLCETERQQCDRINVEAVGHLADACLIHNAHLVHVSTDFIFDGEKGPYKEEDEARPINYYGLSKWKSEQLLQKHTVSYSILRTGLVYGFIPKLSRSNIVLWAREALLKGQPMNIVDDQFRTPSWAEDLAQGCLLAATKKASGIFNISGPDFMNMYELVQIVAREWGLDSTLIKRASTDFVNQRAKRPPKTGFIISKAQKELGYEPYSFVESLRMIEKQMKKHDEGRNH